MVEFILGHKKYDITLDDVLKKMQGVEPEVVRTHAVKIDKKLFPCKQVLAAATGAPKADFNSTQARHNLQRIGLEVLIIPLDNNAAKKSRRKSP